MPSIGCGEREWANLDALIYDASRTRNAIEEVRGLRRLLAAIASRPGGIRVTRVALAGAEDGEFMTMEDPATGDYIIARSYK